MVNRPIFTKLGAELYRDFNTIGNPGSGVFKPIKSDLRTRKLQEENLWNEVYDKLSHVIGSVGGTPNAATGTVTPTLDARAAGQSYWYTPTATNTAAAPTLAIDGTTAGILADADGVNLPIGGVILGRTYLLLDDGTKYRIVGTRDALLFKRLDADDAAGQNVATAQPWFATAGGITLPVGVWWIDALLWLSRTAGITAHTTSFLFAGTATYTIDWSALVNTGDVATIATPALISAATAAATQIKASSSSATEQIIARLVGQLKVTVAGSFIPQFQYSVAPGGTPNAKRGSFIRLSPAPGGLTSIGAWA